MIVIHKIAELPNTPAVYALYGGTITQEYVAYVGIGGSLKQRINQHLVRRDSSIVTGVGAVNLNPDHVYAVRWWEHPAFAQLDRLPAAELIAFDVLEPALRSRGNITGRAQSLYNDADFTDQMRTLLSGPPTGALILPSLSAAMRELTEMRQRISVLEIEVTLLRSELAALHHHAD